MQKLLLALVLSVMPMGTAFATLLAQTDNSSSITSPPAEKKEVEQGDLSQTGMVSPDTGVDYQELQELLAAKQWREANEETRNLMLQAANREEQGWVSTQGIANFSCWDLKTIDKLWREYSGDRFGFSVQLPIFLEKGNRPGKLVNDEAYISFADEIGWRKDGDWIIFKGDLTYSIDAPKGHLPNPRAEYNITGGRLEYTTLAKRMVDCNL